MKEVEGGTRVEKGGGRPAPEVEEEGKGRLPPSAHGLPSHAGRRRDQGVCGGEKAIRKWLIRSGLGFAKEALDLIEGLPYTKRYRVL